MLKSDHSGKKSSWISILSILAAFSLIGCAAAPSSPSVKNTPPPVQEPVQMSAQLIIKFTHALTTDQAPKKLAQLSRQYMVDFQVVREMSGGAFVIKVNNIAGERHLSALLESLKQRGDVAYVERDSMMQHHVMQPNGNVPAR